MSTGPYDAFSTLLETFDRLEMAYLVGGSMASGVYGSPRMTRDIDIVAIQGNRLDTGYLRQWAAYLRVAALLEQALTKHHG